MVHNLGLEDLEIQVIVVINVSKPDQRENSHPSKSIYYSSTSNIHHTIFAFNQILHEF